MGKSRNDEIPTVLDEMKEIQDVFNALSANEVGIICLNYDSIDKNKEKHLYKFLIHKDSRESIILACKDIGFYRIPHPQGKEAGYRMLYQTTEPILLYRDGIFLEFWDQLCCKSYFQNCWLPLDKLINEKRWENVEISEGVPVLNSIDRVVYNISNAFFTERYFKETVKIFLENNSEYLENKEVVTRLQKEFFGFTERLIKRLKAREYSAIFDDYRTFVDY